MGGRRNRRESRSRLRGRDGAYLQEAGNGGGGVEIVIDNGGSRRRRLCCCMPKVKIQVVRSLVSAARSYTN
jgi:hypothetical protein